jgi:hypothetical protein
MRILLFVHWAGICVWLGAQLAFMVFGPAAKKMSLESWANTWVTLARVQRVLIAPAAAAATVTGIALTMAAAKSQAALMGQAWLIVMQTAGLIAGVLALVIVTPLVNKMALLAVRSMEKGQQDPLAERVRSRLALLGSITGALIIVALYTGVIRHY